MMLGHYPNQISLLVYQFLLHHYWMLLIYRTNINNDVFSLELLFISKYFVLYNYKYLFK